MIYGFFPGSEISAIHNLRVDFYTQVRIFAKYEAPSGKKVIFSSFKKNVH